MYALIARTLMVLMFAASKGANIMGTTRRAKSAARLCADLAYQSQRCDAVDRATKRVERLESKLHRTTVRGREMLVRPKGMHWTTYARISAQLVVCH